MEAAPAPEQGTRHGRTGAHCQLMAGRGRGWHEGRQMLGTLCQMIQGRCEHLHKVDKAALGSCRKVPSNEGGRGDGG